jgi:hypothetical protein
MIDVAVKGMKQVLRNLDKAELQNIRDVNTAFRIEGLRLKNLLQRQIRDGAPGGQHFADRTLLSKYWGGRRRPRNNPPLNRLAYGVRYYVPNTVEPRLQVGYVGPVSRSEVAAMTNSGLRLSSSGGFRGIQARNMTSKSWRRLAQIHQEGFERIVSPAQRASLWSAADTVPERIARIFAGAASRRYVFETPARRIIDPFWEQQKHITPRNVRRNYYKLSAGMKV